MASSQPPAKPMTAIPSGARCPICGDETSLEMRPFCSRRCADVDLSRWLKGSYAIASQDDDDDEDGDGGGSSGGGAPPAESGASGNAN